MTRHIHCFVQYAYDPNLIIGFLKNNKMPVYTALEHSSPSNLQGLGDNISVRNAFDLSADCL